MRALLAECLVAAINQPHQDRCVTLSWIAEVKRSARQELRRALDLQGHKSFSASRIERRFSCESAGADKQSRRCQPEKVTELAARYLRFFITLVGKVGLMRSGGFAHIALIGPDPVISDPWFCI